MRKRSDDTAMMSGLRKIVAAKRAFRQRQAALPIAEKLRRLDALREREVAIAIARKKTREDAKK